MTGIDATLCAPLCTIHRIYVFTQNFGRFYRNVFLVIQILVAQCHVIFGRKFMFEKSQNRDVKQSAN